MRTIQILGAAFLVVGVILLGFAYHASNAPMEQLSNTVTGHYSDRTMWYAVLGGVAAVSGGLLAFRSRK